jgi:nicotinamidase/pyrazinamidase
MTRYPALPPRGEEDILLIVDVQNDFCPGGALAVPEGDTIIPLLNRLASRFAHVGLTQDWHPKGHLSFASSHPGKRPFEAIELSYGPQVLWPDHCVQGTSGAAFHPALEVPHAEFVLRKGYHPTIDSYSAFRENDRRTRSGLASYLRERGFARLTLCGLATDFCVLYSALDGLDAGFSVSVVVNASRGIDIDGSLEKALGSMREAGASLVEAET